VLRIRLRRVGAKKQPLYRIVIAENEWPRDGRFLEIIGRYNPRTQPETVEVNEERAYHYLKNGAQPTESVAHMLKKLGTLGRFERLQQGEAAEVVLAEATAAAAATQQTASVRTRPDTLMPSKKNKKVAEKKK
jgi:small subunit ribosomal protein S16